MPNDECRINDERLTAYPRTGRGGQHILLPGHRKMSQSPPVLKCMKVARSLFVVPPAVQECQFFLWYRTAKAADFRLRLNRSAV